jgi:hypothetical protein
VYNICMPPQGGGAARRSRERGGASAHMPNEGKAPFGLIMTQASATAHHAVRDADA